MIETSNALIYPEDYKHLRPFTEPKTVCRSQCMKFAVELVGLIFKIIFSVRLKEVEGQDTKDVRLLKFVYELDW